MLTQALADLTAAVKRNSEVSQKTLTTIASYLQNNSPNDDSIAAGVIEVAVETLNKGAIAMQTEADAIQALLDKATTAAAASTISPAPAATA